MRFNPPIKVASYPLLLMGVLGLIIVRYYESSFFYDPFISYFKHSFFSLQYPELNVVKWLLHLLFRFTINSLFSFLVLYSLGCNKKLLYSLSVLYILIGSVSLLGVGVLYYLSQDWVNVLFFMRRFLIQPLLLLVCLPALWFLNSRERVN